RQMWATRSAAEVVIASRYIHGGTADMPRSRRILSRTLNLVFKRGLSLPYSDLSSGYRLYRRRALDSLELRGTDFNILEEILIRAVAAGFTVQEVPFHYRPRLAAKTHARLASFAVSYLKTFGTMWKLRNSIASADYDARAYDSIVPLQRYWQRRRHAGLRPLALARARMGLRQGVARRLCRRTHHTLRSREPRRLPAGARHDRRIGGLRGWLGNDLQPPEVHIKGAVGSRAAGHRRTPD